MLVEFELSQEEYLEIEQELFEIELKLQRSLFEIYQNKEEARDSLIFSIEEEKKEKISTETL